MTLTSKNQPSPAPLSLWERVLRDPVAIISVRRTPSEIKSPPHATHKPHQSWLKKTCAKEAYSTGRAAVGNCPEGLRVGSKHRPEGGWLTAAFNPILPKTPPTEQETSQSQKKSLTGIIINNNNKTELTPRIHSKILELFPVIDL